MESAPNQLTLPNMVEVRKFVLPLIQGGAVYEITITLMFALLIAEKENIIEKHLEIARPLASVSVINTCGD